MEKAVSDFKDPRKPNPNLKNSNNEIWEYLGWPSAFWGTNDSGIGSIVYLWKLE